MVRYGRAAQRSAARVAIAAVDPIHRARHGIRQAVWFGGCSGVLSRTLWFGSDLRGDGTD